ncbi:MAG: ABC transporter substrate-binding protein [Methylobacteriaceae bacterium]|nr:ABC transporter substrate-binding protein [Methylobacteriaceae bacterium]
MVKRFVIGAVSAAALLLAATSAGAQQPGPAGEPKRGGTLQVVVTPEPPMLMQGLNQNGPTNMIAGNLYESLLRYDEKLNPLPSLAKSWEISPDGTVYTFHLQSGVTWHDGKPFSADDVVFSLDKFLREVHARWRPIANGQIKAVEKVDDATVRITLKQPFGPFILTQEVSFAPSVPKHIYEGTDYRANPANATPIGTGPMKIKEWRKGSFVHFVRTEAYWDKSRPLLDEVYYQFIPDAAARATAFETGRVDVLTGGSVEVFDVARLSKVPGVCVTTKGWEMFSPVGWVVINTKSGILANKTFRQAMMYAIDRDLARDVVWSGYGRPATGPISSKTKFYSPDVPKYAYDPKKARELVKASGYNGEVIKFLGLPYGETWARWAEAIKQNFDEAGIKMEIVSTDVPGWVQRAGSFDFDLTFNFLYQFGDPAAGVARAFISSNIVKGSPFGNIQQYSNPEIDRLFAEAAIAAPDKRQDLYTKIQQILQDELPVLPLLELEYPTVSRCSVKDLVTTAVGINDAMKNAWKQ